jgi:hypothetical protein
MTGVRRFELTSRTRRTPIVASLFPSGNVWRNVNMMDSAMLIKRLIEGRSPARLTTCSMSLTTGSQSDWNQNVR